MCRFLAYAASVPTPVASLVPATLAEFIALARENPDGWGQAAWNGGEVVVERSLRSAGEDPRFMEVANRPLGDMGIVHLRAATPPLPVNLDNSHPFIRDGLMMAHNGAIFPQETMDDMLLPGSSYVPRGTTDSERYFLAIAEEIDRGADPVTAIRRTVARILERFQPSFLNAFLATSDRLYAVQWHMPEPYREEYYRLFTPEVLKVYFDIRYALLDGGIVMGSTGWTQPGWHTVTRRHILEVERHTLELTEHDLFSDASRRIAPDAARPSEPEDARSAVG
jgi:predicted glutamine amidotransferase